MKVYILTRDDECLDPECCGGYPNVPVKVITNLEKAQEWSKEYKQAFIEMELDG